MRFRSVGWYNLRLSDKRFSWQIRPLSPSLHCSVLRCSEPLSACVAMVVAILDAVLRVDRWQRGPNFVLWVANCCMSGEIHPLVQLLEAVAGLIVLYYGRPRRRRRCENRTVLLLLLRQGRHRKCQNAVSQSVSGLCTCCSWRFVERREDSWTLHSTIFNSSCSFPSLSANKMCGNLQCISIAIFAFIYNLYTARASV